MFSTIYSQVFGVGLMFFTIITYQAPFKCLLNKTTFKCQHNFR